MIRSDVSSYKELLVLFFASQSDWEQWLALHYNQPQGVWLKFAKNASGIASLHYNQALEEALCYGWIDGQAKTIDATYYLQKFTPRRQGSHWSKRNIALVTKLKAEGRVKPSGLAAIEAAKKNGQWHT